MADSIPPVSYTHLDLKSGQTQCLFYLFCSICLLKMHFLKLMIKPGFTADKECQVIFIDAVFWIIEILPDKTALLPVFRKRIFSKQCFIFIKRVHVKQKDPDVYKRQDDVLLTQQEDQLRNCFSGDVQIKGYYPYFMKNYFEKNNIKFECTDEDIKLIKEGVCDFYTFSYYMTNCITINKEVTQVSGNIMGGAKNPYLKATEWNWQIDPVGLRSVSYTHLDVYKRQLYY